MKKLLMWFCENDMSVTFCTAFFCFVLSVLCAVCTGCTPNIRNPETAGVDLAAVSRTHESWNMAFGSSPTTDNCFDNVKIVTLVPNNFTKTCGKAPFFSVGCVLDRGVGHRRGKTIYLSPSVRPDRRDHAIVEVSLHALLQCSGRVKRKNDPTDKNHMYPGVWMERDGENSLEAHIVGGLEFRDRL